MVRMRLEPATCTEKNKWVIGLIYSDNVVHLSDFS